MPSFAVQQIVYGALLSMKVRNINTLCPYIFKAFYDWLVDSDVTPHLLIKVQTKGVIVPSQFREQDVMVLSISPSAVRNFDIGPKYLSFNTRFSGVDEYIVIPYKAMCDLIAHEDQVAFPINMWMQQDLEDDEENQEDSYENEYMQEEDENCEDSADDSAIFRTVDDINDAEDSAEKNKNKDNSTDGASDDGSMFTVVDKD